MPPLEMPAAKMRRRSMASSPASVSTSAERKRTSSRARGRQARGPSVSGAASRQRLGIDDDGPFAIGDVEGVARPPLDLGGAAPHAVEDVDEGTAGLRGAPRVQQVRPPSTVSSRSTVPGPGHVRRQRVTPAIASAMKIAIMNGRARLTTPHYSPGDRTVLRLLRGRATGLGRMSEGPPETRPTASSWI